MDKSFLTDLTREVYLRQDKTNRLLVAIARRLDRNERSMRRLMQQQLRFFKGPLEELEHFGDDLSYEDSMNPPAQSTNAKTQKPFEGRSRHEVDGDGSNFFRHELPGLRWLIIKTDSTMRVQWVKLELPDGSVYEMTPEEALSQFGDLPIWGMAMEPTLTHNDPTEASLNPDTEDIDG